jgi:hypothetical protein
VTILAALAAAPADRVADGLTALIRLVLLARALGVAGGIALALAGLAALTVADRLRRPTAALGGALTGALAALALRGLLAAHLGASPALATGVAAAAGALAGALVPALFPAAAGALAGALVGVHLPLAGRAELGAAAAGIVGAALALLGARAVTVCLAVTGGGLALGAGLLALGGARPLAVELAGRPFALLGFALVAAIAGGAFQLSRDGPERGRGADLR